MPRLRNGNGDRVDGEDLAVARRRHRWTFGADLSLLDDPAWAPADVLEDARAEPSAATHPDCCWCHRCVVRARAAGGTPMDVVTCWKVHRGECGTPPGSTVRRT